MLKVWLKDRIFRLGDRSPRRFTNEPTSSTKFVVFSRATAQVIGVYYPGLVVEYIRKWEREGAAAIEKIQYPFHRAAAVELWSLDGHHCLPHVFSVSKEFPLVSHSGNYWLNWITIISDRVISVISLLHHYFVVWKSSRSESLSRTRRNHTSQLWWGKSPVSWSFRGLNNGTWFWWTEWFWWFRNL